MISLRLLATVAVKHKKAKKKKRKKENSPLPDDLAGCLVICRVGAQLGTDPRSHNAAVLFWSTDVEAPSDGRG